jgi:hypothetical protein
MERSSRPWVLTAMGFAGGVGAVLFFQSLTQSSPHYGPSTLLRRSEWEALYVRAFPQDIGSTVVHEYPPASPTNNVPALFPTQVGFPGATQTGAEAALAVTAPSYPYGAGTQGLVKPSLAQGHSTPSWIDTSGSSNDFSIFQNWANLSPFYSVPADSFGLGSDTSPDVPKQCKLKGVHILHRHGARYPGSACECPNPTQPSRIVTLL